jgi:PAS domain S-box-containing protein
MGINPWDLGGDGRAVQELLDSIRDYAIFLLDRDGHIRTWNTGAKAIKGYEPHEIIGHHFSRFFTPDDARAGRPARLLAAAARDGRVEDEAWRVRKDGSRFWADVIITALRNRAGELTGFVKITRDLSERRAAEEALRRSEESLAATLYSIGDGVIGTDESGLVTRINPVAEHLTGWPRSEAIGQPIDRIFNIVNEETRARVENPVARVLRDGAMAGLAYHTALVARDGTERPIADSGAPIRDRVGAMRGAVLVFRDVTEERRADEALRQSEQKLRLMIESVRDYAIYMLDADGLVTSWNAGAERLEGYRADEIVGSHFSRVYIPEDVQAGKPQRELETAAVQGRYEDEGWHVGKDGSRFWANVVLSAIRDSEGQLVGFTKVTRDMSDRRRAEQQLTRRALQQAAVAELGLHAIRSRDLQSVLDGAVAIATTTLETDMSKVLELEPDGAWFRLRAGVGWRAGLVGDTRIPRTPRSLIEATLHAEDPIVVEDAAALGRMDVPAFLREHGVVSGMSAVIPIPGQERPYGIIGTHARRRMSFSRDDVVFFQALAAVVATAIGRARAEAQLREAEASAAEQRRRTAQAEQAVRERDVFLSVAAHELRTPLTALQLKLQGLEQMVRRHMIGAPVAGRAQTRFRDALRQTERLTELVERLLDVSRIAAGRFEVQRTPFELGGLVQVIVDDLRERASESGTDLRITVSGDTRGSWDRRRLEQVLLNLLSNAVKYGAGKPVDVIVEGCDGEVRLLVSDQGIGIADVDRERIFDAFERAAPVEHFAGLGLGLYIARRIVEAHGGQIEVSSVPGQGATFAVTLPKLGGVELAGGVELGGDR